MRRQIAVIGRFATAIIAVGLAFIQPARAAQLTQPQRVAYERAYQHSLRCWYANVAIKDNAGSRLAFDAVVKLGRLLGYENRKLNSDLETGGELAHMARSDSYTQSVIADCARLGLASNSIR
jgi:hypothetical protein